MTKSTGPGNYKHSSGTPGKHRLFFTKKIPELFLQTTVALLFSYGFFLFFHHFIARAHPSFNKIEDLELSDFGFRYRHEVAQQDTNIYIINCAKGSRDDIAHTITTLCNADAKVIGLDVTFLRKYHTDSNSRSLISVLKENKGRIVLVSNYMDRFSANKEELDETIYLPGFTYGYIPYDENLYETKRYFEPYYLRNEKEDTDTMYSFAYEVLKKYKGFTDTGLKRILTSHRVINYRKAKNGQSRYTVLNKVSEISREKIAGKIALVGNWDSVTLEDRHYTPLNANLGRSWPDMNGTEYHAQVISMFINSDYIEEIPGPVKYALILLLTLLFFWWMNSLHGTIWEHIEHPIAEIAVSILAIIFIFCSIYLLNTAHIKFEPVTYLIPLSIAVLFHNAIKMFSHRKNKNKPRH